MQCLLMKREVCGVLHHDERCCTWQLVVPVRVDDIVNHSGVHNLVTLSRHQHQHGLSINNSVAEAGVEISTPTILT